MNEPDPTEVIANLLRGPESKRAMDALGIDSSEVSRFLSGQRGFRFDQIEAMLKLGKFDLIDTQGHLLLVTLASKALVYERARLAVR